ncbi:hypothetical protein DdX_09190 [Ditylenchus destructor]|uniref:Uncharacterized protein n=1 Tax=Ditylenchus destructor TaxID=166010 RepID=A0AAD4N262_9BILA|nr:hypothetical protein DdX_09190 [Ditylenchus destructor]
MTTFAFVLLLLSAAVAGKGEICKTHLDCVKYELCIPHPRFRVLYCELIPCNSDFDCLPYEAATCRDARSGSKTCQTGRY